MIDEARTRWPDVAFDAAAIAALLAERGLDAPPPYAVDLVLACACVAGDAPAQRVFFAEMFDRVERVLARLGMSAADMDDIKQEVRSKLLLGARKLAQYQGTGPLAQWVASVAGREALMLLRRRKPSNSIDDEVDVLDAGDDPALQALKAQHGADFKRAFQESVESLPPRDRAILRALVVDDRSVNDVAAVYGVHRVTASRWVSEIRRALLMGTRTRLRDTLRLSDASLDSAIRLVDSQLDMSLYRLLRDAA